MDRDEREMRASDVHARASFFDRTRPCVGPSANAVVCLDYAAPIFGTVQVKRRISTSGAR
jgi:hypothetical protein